MIIPNNICDENTWLADLQYDIKRRRDLANFSDVFYRTKYIDALTNISDCLSIEIMDNYKGIGASANVNYFDSIEEYQKFIKKIDQSKDWFFNKITETRVDACTQLLALITAVLKYDYNDDVVNLIKRLAIRTGKAKYLTSGYTNVK